MRLVMAAILLLFCTACRPSTPVDVRPGPVPLESTQPPLRITPEVRPQDPPSEEIH